MIVNRQRNNLKIAINRIFKFIPYLIIIAILIISLTFLGIAAEQEDFKKSIQINNPRAVFSMSIRSDREAGAAYRPGDRIRIYFNTSRDAYVTLFGYDTQGNIRVLFPNRNQSDPHVEANQRYHIDIEIQRGTSPGIFYIQGFATTNSAINARELERAFSEGSFDSIQGKIRRFISRVEGILSNLSYSQWASSDIFHYRVAERRPETGQLRINSSPEGAQVYLNERYVGRTPLITDQLSPGEYQLRLEESGYRTWSQTIQIRSNRTEYIDADLEQIQRYGTIALQSNVADARIYLDGQLVDYTRKDSTVLLERIREGSHSIRISLEGYLDWSSEINIRPNERLQLSVNLERILQTGTLEISSNVGNARIYLDGVYYGRTSSGQSVRFEDVEEGTYTLRVTREGYQDYTDTITIYPDYSYHKHVQLRPQYQKSPLFSDIDIDPDTVNLQSNSQWITAYIGLSGNYQVEDIDFDTVRAWHENKNIPAEWGDIQNKRLMVKFSGNAFRNLFSGSSGYASVRVSGELHDGTRFEGSDEIRVLHP